MLLIEDPEYRKKLAKMLSEKNVTNVSFDRTSRKLWHYLLIKNDAWSQLFKYYLLVFPNFFDRFVKWNELRQRHSFSLILRMIQIYHQGGFCSSLPAVVGGNGEFKMKIGENWGKLRNLSGNNSGWSQPWRKSHN